MADDKSKGKGKQHPTPPLTKAGKDKAVAKDPDIRGVNRQESRG